MTAEEQLKAAMKEVTRLREMVAVKDEKITSLTPGRPPRLPP